MEEIKFRIWNLKHKEFSYWGFLEDGIFTSIPAGGIMSIGYCKKYSQQFTGLLDKQGKEIYEGDILKLDGGADEKPIMKVGFEEGMFVVYPDWLKDNTTKYVEARAYCNFKEEIMTIEIIGNVWENPELIK